ncbi:recombinase family protein [Bacillus sp. B1-b2]|uniref:recombinase family protein n=1 Tax=Bacillus sp. B1-b2 TaxID=2653201 RepID=UPI001869A77B|nr:recombinase family protein [Bacillus sp. B1-b2]
MQRNIKRSLVKKKTAEYKRTSSGGQDLKLQSETNAEYLRDTPKENTLEFTDYDVSATKLSMENRPALGRMLKIIENGMISRVVVYERDRLARNVYEYIYIVKKFYEYEVEVVFTASDAPPFSKELFLETWYGLSGDLFLQI